MRAATNLAIALVASLAATGVAHAQPLFTYFNTVPGTAPIILSAPHGGTLTYPFPERSCTGDEVCVLDTNTRQLAQATINEFYALTGLRPYVVIAQGHRKFIDFNRSAEQAYTHPDAEEYYDYYHDHIDMYMEDIREKFGRGLMIDIHGQAESPTEVLRGTKNGQSVSEMLGVWGEEALNGPNSLLGSLDSQGITADPSLDIPFAEQIENPSYDGGHITTSNGSNHADGIDTIQLEFGIDFRGGSAWQDTAAKLALALHKYHSTYLQQPITPGDYNNDGIVNAADYTSWRDAFGSPAGTLPNGVNGGVIGDAHYDTWQTNFGSSQPLGSIALQESAATVPEPTAFAMVAFAFLLTFTTESLRNQRQIFL